jgi:polysaccharide chain length determinant protein (PEP-CTERM system associated)
MVGTVLSLLYDELVRIWCYRWTAITAAAALFFAGAAYVMQLPSVYDSWAQIYIPKQTPLAQAASNVSLVGDGYGSTSAYVVQKTLLNDQSLRQVAEQLNPSFARQTPATQESAIQSLRSHIEIGADQGDGFTEFHYKATDPARAHRVVQLLLNQFVAANEDRTQKDLDQADLFLDTQIAVYQRKLAESQKKLTDFRQRYGNVADTADTVEEADAATEVANARAAYTAALARDGGVNTPQQDEIAALEAKIAALRLQYTDQYPDVVAARQQLAMLRQAPQQAKVGESPAVVTARADLANAQARLRRARFHPELPPQVASEEADLKRNDDVLRNAYQELLARREAAKVSMAVYNGNNSAKYQITNQPTMPTAPSGPNRPLLLMAVIVAAIAGGLGAAYLRGAITGVFVAPRELEDAFQLPVIGTISWEKTWHTGAAAENPRHAAIFVAFGVVLLAATILVLFSTSAWLQTFYRDYSASMLHLFVR